MLGTAAYALRPDAWPCLLQVVFNSSQFPLASGTVNNSPTRLRHSTDSRRGALTSLSPNFAQARFLEEELNRLARLPQTQALDQKGRKTGLGQPPYGPTSRKRLAYFSCGKLRECGRLDTRGIFVHSSNSNLTHSLQSAALLC